MRRPHSTSRLTAASRLTIKAFIFSLSILVGVFFLQVS